MGSLYFRKRCCCWPYFEPCLQFQRVQGLPLGRNDRAVTRTHRQLLATAANHVGLAHPKLEKYVDPTYSAVALLESAASTATATPQPGEPQLWKDCHTYQEKVSWILANANWSFCKVGRSPKAKWWVRKRNGALKMAEDTKKQVAVRLIREHGDEAGKAISLKR